MANPAITKLIIEASKIQVVSGEILHTGEGVIETFTGRRTRLALRRRLAKEQDGKERFAFALLDGLRVDFDELRP